MRRYPYWEASVYAVFERNAMDYLKKWEPMIGKLYTIRRSLNDVNLTQVKLVDSEHGLDFAHSLRVLEDRGSLGLFGPEPCPAGMFLGLFPSFDYTGADEVVFRPVFLRDETLCTISLDRRPHAPGLGRRGAAAPRSRAAFTETDSDKWQVFDLACRFSKNTSVTHVAFGPTMVAWNEVFCELPTNSP